MTVCEDDLLLRLQRCAVQRDATTPETEFTFIDAAAWLLEPPAPVDPILDGVFDVGDKVFVLGGSKCRKSFFTMQLALCIASGSDTLGFIVPKPRRVAICQFEIKPEHYHRRMLRMANALGYGPEAIEGRLFVANLRGQNTDLERIGDNLQTYRPELVLFDPLYKLYGQGHDENSAGDAALLLAQFDRLAERLGCATLTVHHDRKGATGDLRATDRGAGSGVLSRDYDASLILTPHASEDDAAVLSCVLRNYAPRTDISIRWTDNHFMADENLIPAAETAQTRKAKTQSGPRSDELIPRIADWFEGKPIPSAELKTRIRTTFCVGQRKADTIVQEMKDRLGYLALRNQETKCTEIHPPEQSPCNLALQGLQSCEVGTGTTSQRL